MSEAVSGEVWGRVGMCRVVEVSAFLKNYFPIALLGISHKNLYTEVPRSFNHSNLKLETTQLSCYD
jgi:hypothetical protein